MDNPPPTDARFVGEVRGPEDLADVDTRRSGGSVGLGGMATKIEAAVIATGAGIPVLLAAATSVGAALQGLTGTYFHPGGDRTASRLFWLRHASTPRGRLTLDRGAIVAEEWRVRLPASSSE
jgi:glutamate 5-kinase